MSDVGILGFGAYIPRRRLHRAAAHAANGWFAPGLKGLARGERAVAHWDEDVVTMAVEAARDALGTRERAELRAVTLASTTHPFADRQNAGIVKEALNLDDMTATMDVGGSLRAGLSALIATLQAAAGREGMVLCVSAEKRGALPGSEAELVQGDAAAAFVVGRGMPLARMIATASLSADFVDHFRASGEATDYGWEARWLRDEGYAKLAPRAVKAALAKAGLDGGGIHRFLFPVTARGVGAQVAKACGIPADRVADPLGDSVGDSGAAHPLLMLAAALEASSPGEVILVAGFGSGCDVAILVRGEGQGPGGVARWLARKVPETNYMRHLVFTGALRMERGMRAEFDNKQPLTALWRERKTVLGLVGGRTPDGAVQFPRTRIPVGGDMSGIDTLVDHPLAERTARILTHTADSLTYTPDPPAYYGMIEFDGGGRMVAEYCDIEPDDVVVGREMRMMFRIKSIDEARHFTRYFWKAAPAEEA